MIAFDTVASQPFVLAYALVADATNRQRALYGVATIRKSSGKRTNDLRPPIRCSRRRSPTAGLTTVWS